MREQSLEAEAVVPGSQGALHLEVFPPARSPLIARLQTQILHSRAQEEVVVEVALQYVSVCFA